MKILITTDLYKPQINGVVTSVLNLEKELRRLGHEVKVLTLSPHLQTSESRDTYYMPSVSTSRIYPGTRLSVVPRHRYFNEICAWGPDIIHTQCEFSSFQFARYLARRLDVPIVHTYHTVYEDYTHYIPGDRLLHIGKRVAEFISRYSCCRAETVIVPTQKIAELLRSYGIQVELAVIPTGIQLDRFQKRYDSEALREERRRLGIPEGDRLCVYLGRLAPEKNCGELLEYFSRAAPEACSLLIAGGGPALEDLRAQAAALPGREKIFFSGMVPPEQVPFYYQMGDLFLCASVSETQGITYIEALASGLPALCRRDSCIRDIILEGYTGAQYDTYEDFARHLRHFLEDDALRTRLGQNAQALALRYGSARFAADVLQVYEDCVSRRRRWQDILSPRDTAEAYQAEIK